MDFMKTLIPAVGSVVELTTKQPNHYIFTAKEQPFVFRKIVGKVVQNEKWLEADYVSIETGNSNYPVSMISFKRIHDIKVISGRSSNFQEFPVIGSKGQKYIVSKSNNHYSCSCTGFKFHGKCKHINLVKDDRYE